MTESPIYGLMAEFETPTGLVEAAKGAYAAGYRKMDTYTPYPLEEAAEAIGAHHNRVPLIVLVGAMLGMIGGYSLEYWVSVLAYPINVGGRPLLSLPAFIPITFESGILVSAFAAILTWLALAGLPELHAPVFDVDGFNRATIDRFWVGVDERDPKYDADAIERVFRELGALSVHRAKERTR